MTSQTQAGDSSLSEKRLLFDAIARRIEEDMALEGGLGPGDSFREGAKRLLLCLPDHMTTAPELVAKILAERDSPLHYREIAGQAELRSNRLSASTAYKVLRQHSAFTRVSRGIYELSSHPLPAFPVFAVECDSGIAIEKGYGRVRRAAPGQRLAQKRQMQLMAPAVASSRQ